MSFLKQAREPVNGWTHLVAAIAAVFGLIGLLLINREVNLKFAALLVYGLSLILMFSASASYHLINGTPAVQRRLRIFDHTAIYLLIAGTYTPICLQFLSGFWRWGFLGTIWVLAAIGIGAASRTLTGAPSFDRAVLTLTALVVFQATANALWLAATNRAELGAVGRSWRPAAMVGVLSLLAIGCPAESIARGL